MPPSEIRREARKALKGNWGKALCIILAYTLISFVIGFVEGLAGEGTILYNIISIVYAILSIPLSFGLIISFIKLQRGENPKAFGFIKDGFSRFGKSWGIWFHTFLRMLLPIVCMGFALILLIALFIYNAMSSISSWLIILSVVLYIATLVYVISRSFLYILAYYIGYDKPELSSKECVKRSAKLMKGNRGNYFLLQLSFIGWGILSILSIFVGMLWLIPYIAIAEVCFYDRIASKEA